MESTASSIGDTISTNGVTDDNPLYRYEKELISTKEYVKENLTSDFSGRVKSYLISLFPIFSWIYRYNLVWATGGFPTVVKSIDIRSHCWANGWDHGCSPSHVLCKACQSPC